MKLETCDFVWNQPKNNSLNRKKVNLSVQKMFSHK